MRVTSLTNLHCSLQWNDQYLVIHADENGAVKNIQSKDTSISSRCRLVENEHLNWVSKNKIWNYHFSITQTQRPGALSL